MGTYCSAPSRQNTRCQLRRPPPARSRMTTWTTFEGSVEKTNFMGLKSSFLTIWKVSCFIFVSSERPGGVSSLPGRLSWCHFTGPLAVRVALCSLLQHLARSWKEGRRGRRGRQEGEEEKRPQRAPETRVGIRSVLQGHTSSHQGTKSKRHLRRGFKDSGVHVGQPGGGAKTGERNKDVLGVFTEENT